ncbi:MBL fold metallo-hydrolase [Limibacter armeniacum]|uniref:MBL fold metallo-hydrolase n=1 Tax=Limibacter armeniacum TaxID=466084 RepID=UPI002FE6B4E6
MREIARDVYQISLFPRHGINAYLIGDVLIDSGSRQSFPKIVKALKNKKLSAHALTHAHPDHQGSSKEVCEVYNVPLWCGGKDAEAMETGDYTDMIPKNNISSFVDKQFRGPAHPVDKQLQEGDEVAGFTVLDVPGHSPGHVAYWREKDGVLILGDVLRNMNYATTLSKLAEPPKVFTPDPEQNRKSILKIAELKPKLITFGHGAPLTDMDKLYKLVDSIS